MWNHLPVESLIEMKTCGSWRRTLNQIRQLPEHQVPQSGESP